MDKVQKHNSFKSECLVHWLFWRNRFVTYNFFSTERINEKLSYQVSTANTSRNNAAESSEQIHVIFNCNEQKTANKSFSLTIKQTESQSFLT